MIDNNDNTNTNTNISTNTPDEDFTAEAVEMTAIHKKLLASAPDLRTRLNSEAIKRFRKVQRQVREDSEKIALTVKFITHLRDLCDESADIPAVQADLDAIADLLDHIFERDRVSCHDGDIRYLFDNLLLAERDFCDSSVSIWMLPIGQFFECIYRFMRHYYIDEDIQRYIEALPDSILFTRQDDVVGAYKSQRDECLRLFKSGYHKMLRPTLKWRKEQRFYHSIEQTWQQQFTKLTTQATEKKCTQLVETFAEMFELLDACHSNKPTKTFAKKCIQHIAVIGHENYVHTAVAMLELAIAHPYSKEPYYGGGYFGVYLKEEHAQFMRAVVWSIDLLVSHASPYYETLNTKLSDSVARKLGELAKKSHKSLASVGAGAPKLGNACISVLGTMQTPASIAELAQLKLNITQKPTLKLVEKQLALAEAQTGISADELAEMAVPDFGLVVS